MTLYFKEEGGLATHPSSCHPWRVFGCPESERKGEKIRETGEREGRVESFQPKSFINGEDTFIVLMWGFYIAPAKQNYKKNQNKKLLQFWHK